jgi:hypothetical protein
MSERGAGPGMDYLFNNLKDKQATGKSDEVKSTDSKPIDVEPVEVICDEGKSVEVSVDEGKPEDSKSAEVTSGSVKPFKEKRSGVKSSKCLSVKPPQAETSKPLKANVIHDAVEVASSHKQRIAVWSPLVSATMWYLKATTPMFSISDEARELIEEGLERKYPELFKRVKVEMGKV